MSNNVPYIAFNQDSTCFSYGKGNGFAVYNCEPPKERFNRFSANPHEPNGIGIVELLYRSNILALVGGGDTPKFPTNALMLWDDFQCKCIAELEFKSPVTGVKLKKTIIVVSTNDKTYVYNFGDLKLLYTFETSPNPSGVFTVSTGEPNIVAVLGKVPGTVVVKNLETNTQHLLEAHTNNVTALALNVDGDKLATASERGTIIRLWDTRSGKLLKELRRGLEVVTVTSLEFDADSMRLLVCSEKGTVHVFSLMDTPEETANRRSSLVYWSNYLPHYFSSEWSAISFTVAANSICTFGSSPDTIYVICRDNAHFYKYRYDTKTGTGECVDGIDICRLSQK